MRQSEFKMRYDPELGRYTRQHIYGEGMMDVFKSFGKKIFGNTIPANSHALGVSLTPAG